MLADPFKGGAIGLNHNPLVPADAGTQFCQTNTGSYIATGFPLSRE